MNILFQYLNEASVTIAIVSFLGISGWSIFNKIPIKLEDLLGKIMAASAIPTGIALLLCAFDPGLLSKMTGFNIHIATAGIALLYMSTKAVFMGVSKASKKSANNGLETDAQKTHTAQSDRYPQ